MLRFGNESLCYSCGHNEFFFSTYTKPDSESAKIGVKKIVVVEKYTCMKCGMPHTYADTFYED